MICVPDLRQGMDAYARIGFDVRPGGIHTVAVQQSDGQDRDIGPVPLDEHWRLLRRGADPDDDAVAIGGRRRPDPAN